MRFIAIRTWLLGSTDITTAVATRVFSGHIPQGITGTSIVISKISGSHEYSLANQLGLVAYRYQLDVYDNGGTPQKTVEEVGELVRNRLSGYRGQLDANVFCHGAFIDSDDDSEDRPIDSSDKWKARTSLDVVLHLAAVAPTHT